MRHCCDHRNVTYEDVETVRPDLTVVGGGIAGTCAAVAAAREGLDVALVNDRPVLGGSSSSEIRESMCFFYLLDGLERALVRDAREDRRVARRLLVDADDALFHLPGDYLALP